MTAITLRGDDIDRNLGIADDLAKDQGASLAGELPEWHVTFQGLFRSDCPLTYLPVLMVTLLARMASDDVNVMRIQPKDEYSASLVGQRLVAYGREHEIDVRTDSSNVMNSQPFVRQPEILSDLSDKPQYAEFFRAVEAVNRMRSEEALRVLALGLHLGRENWPHRSRRKQKNLIHQPARGDAASNYFILNQSPHEDFQHYDGEDYYGFHENVTSAKALVEAGAGNFVFYRTSDAKDAPMTFVGHGTISHVERKPDDDEGRQTFHAFIDGFKPFQLPVPKAEGAPQGWNSQNSISRISKEAFERLLELGGKESTPLEPMSLDDVRAACDRAGLIVPDRVLVSLLGALDSGKHVVLTGPPGTAKTTLAVLIADLAQDRGQSAGSMVTTATADWSTYDTIGGLAPQADGTLSFRPGRFIEALATDRWLIVDELNRANFDRAFGQLFTVLAGQDVVLPYSDSSSGLPIRLRNETGAPDSAYSDVVVRAHWRMLATLNNFDKSLLFELSFALMRRFAFVEVPVPSEEEYRELAGRPVLEDAEDVASVVRGVVDDLLPVRDVREIGPAVFIDASRMARSMALISDLTRQEIALQVFHALFLPQFEGIEETDGRRLFKLLRKAVGPTLAEDGRRMLREVLGVRLVTTAEEEIDEADTPSNHDLG